MLGMHEFRALKCLKFPYTICTVGLSIHDLKPLGAGYVSVTRIWWNTSVLLTKAWSDFMFFISNTQMLDSFFPQFCSTSAKDMLPFSKSKTHFIV
jgi:hypothetical protein